MRQSAPKSFSVTFAVGMLLAHKVAASENPSDAAFATRRGTWPSPNTVRRQ
jgi:hypothetical protein